MRSYDISEACLSPAEYTGGEKQIETVDGRLLPQSEAHFYMGMWFAEPAAMNAFALDDATHDELRDYAAQDTAFYDWLDWARANGKEWKCCGKDL